MVEAWAGMAVGALTRGGAGLEPSRPHAARTRVRTAVAICYAGVPPPSLGMREIVIFT